VAAFEGTTAFNFAAAFGGTGEVRACPWGSTLVRQGGGQGARSWLHSYRVIEENHWNIKRKIYCGCSPRIVWSARGLGKPTCNLLDCYERGRRRIYGLSERKRLIVIAFQVISWTFIAFQACLLRRRSTYQYGSVLCSPDCQGCVITLTGSRSCL
jgi:hypothetical protein